MKKLGLRQSSDKICKGKDSVFNSFYNIKDDVESSSRGSNINYVAKNEEN